MFCNHCGAQIHDEAVICTSCGCSVSNPKAAVTNANAEKDDTLAIVIKVFLIISCVAQGIFILPLAWCLPITISVCNRLRDGQPIGVGLKICTLLFVNIIAGVCLLCKDEV